MKGLIFLYAFLFSLILAIFLFFIIHFILKLKERKIRNSIPKEILEDFEYAEQKLKGGINEDGSVNQECNPYTILWEITKRNRIRDRIRETESEERGVESKERRINAGELYTKPIGRQDIQVSTASDISKDTSVIRKPAKINIRDLIARRRKH